MEDFYLSVSDLKNFRFGDEERRYSTLVDYGFDIDPDSAEKNSEILYGEFPKEAAVAGLVHDAALVLYAKENSFPGDPGSEQLSELLEGMVMGERSRTPEGVERDIIGRRIRGLERDYDIAPAELLEQESYGRTVKEMLDDVADYRAENWREDLGDVKVEEWVEDEELGVRGRMDMILDGKAVELKTGFPREEHAYQAFIYGELAGLPALVDYPLQARRIPVEQEWDIEKDAARLREEVAKFVRRQLREIEDGYDEALGHTALRPPGETLNEFRQRMAEELGEEKEREIVENATRKATEVA